MCKFEGRTLQVDLGTGKSERGAVPPEMTDAYIGGRGLGGRLLLDLLPPGTDPLSPGNILMFITGPLTGTPFSGTGKYVVVCKSPATGSFCDSYSSGLLAPALRFAGYDVLILTGRAPAPSYLWIKDDHVEVRPADDLWGLDAFEAEDRLRERHGHYDVGVAVIGPAGENLVKFASIGSDYYRHAGRGGVGAVMGSKNLKAVVVQGTGGVPLADPRRVMALQAKQLKRLGQVPAAQARIKYGTPSTFTVTNAAGMLPTRNFREGIFPEGQGVLDGEGVLRITIGHAGCYACLTPCGRLVEVTRGDERIRIEGPEYETLALMGSNLGIDDPAVVVQENLLCDKLGMDTISAGNVVGFAMECAERGLLHDTWVSDLRFGDSAGALRLLEEMALRRGIGAWFAEGVKSASQKIGGGSERFAIHVKGLELPAYDPRAGFGSALTYAVTPRGACHRRAWPPAKEVLGGVPPFTVEGKAAMVKGQFQDRGILHCLIVCDTAHGVGLTNIREFSEFVEATTGRVYSEAEWQAAEDRMETTIRLFNVREGFTRKDDVLPWRLLEEAQPEGPAKGQIIGRAGLDQMLDEYYALRGWDAQGVPLPETLEKYGIPVKESE
ncbi:MAG: aldehyde ferredoxin oxidoreductase family protein [Acidobacteriota bacterium]